MQYKDNYQLMLEKLDEFIRKYYINHLIRGALYSTAVLVVLFVSFTLLEHFIFNASISSMSLRKTLFFSFAGVSAATLGWLVFRPLVHYFKLGSIISHEKAAQIIGYHFSNVQDKLLNVLQLKQQASSSHAALVQASIDQKIGELRPVPFQAAIDLTENKRYLRYVLPPLLLLLLLLLFSNIVENSARRILQNNQEFEREMLFKLSVKNESPKVVQFEDYTLEVQVDGEELPSEVFVSVDNYKYKLEKVNNTTFKYTFSKLQKDTDFRLSANGFTSKKYTVDVLEKPNIANFDVQLNYPSYTGRTNEKVNNVGDLTVPAGTNMEWLFQTQFTDQIFVQFADGSREPVSASGENAFKFAKKISTDGQYKIFVSNNNLPNGDSVSYTITVIPDLYPTIDVKKFQDSSNVKQIFFAGEASDDYGIRGVNFHYQIERNGKIAEQKTIPVESSKGKQTTYDYMLDVDKLQIKPGDRLSYYFQVSDNDGVNGSKSAKTAVMYLEMPTMEEIKQQEQANNSEIKSEIDDAMKKLQEMNNDLKKAQNSLLQKDQMGWQERRELENLIKQQQEIQKQVEQAKKNLEENLKNQEQFQKVDSNLVQKQKELEKLMEQVMNDEMKKLFEELEKMLDQMNKEQIMEKIKDIQMSDEEMQKELDRMMELFKQLEVEKDLNDVMQELDSLAKRQDELSKETEKPENKDNAAKQEELKKQQNEINKKFDELQEKFEKTLDKNEKLENPMEMDEQDLKQDQKEIEQELKEISDQLKQKKNDDASKSQKIAAKKMREAGKKIREKVQGEAVEKMKEDLRAMRQLLENLVTMSFEQEKLFEEIDRTIPTAPQYVKLVQRQYKLKDDFRHVEDSLQALSKRVIQIESFVTEKVTDIKKSISKSLVQLEDRQKRPAVVQQQYTMTALNDLALMLSEAMKQMQQQTAEKMPGEQMCEKPGEGEEEGDEGDNPNGKPGSGKKGKKGKGKGMGDLRMMQEDLKKQMEQMQQQMKNGQMPGSKQFAEMAAKQAAIRKALQDLKKQQQQQGKGGQELQDLIDQMNKTETELVNKQLSNDALKRQQDIVTRLLESEKAQREREFEEKREAQRPENVEPKMPPALAEYLKKRQSQVDMFKTVSPALKPYYKGLVENYFNTLK